SGGARRWGPPCGGPHSPRPHGATYARGRRVGRLNSRPKKPVPRHGDDGVVRGPSGEDMFYYFIPRCAVAGTVTVGGRELPLQKGQGWYDHEFGGPRPDAKIEEERPDVAWNWASLQLPSGDELSAYALVRMAARN